MDIDALPQVMGPDGEFHAVDEEVDLSGTTPEAWLALGLFWLLGLTVFLQFFTRYVLNNSFAWTEEIAVYCLVAVVFVGSSMCVRLSRHIHVDFLYRYLHGAPGRFVRRQSIRLRRRRYRFALGPVAWRRQRSRDQHAARDRRQAEHPGLPVPR